MFKRKILLGLIITMVIGCVVGCGHEHTFSEATCVLPRTCLECGETEGDPNGHIWNDATCTEPKTCSVCGETEGQPNGHDKEIGFCTVCDELANEEVFNQIDASLNTMVDLFSNITSTSESANYTDVDDVYNHFVTIDTYMKLLSLELDNLTTSCGDYDEAKALKNAAGALKKKIPSKVSSRKKDDVVDYMDKLMDFTDEKANYLQAVKEYYEDVLNVE